jgi:predicted AAA+ superfamily ATPase
MYKRQLEQQIRRLVRQYPVVTLVGPRQSGKSTLCEYVFPDLPLYNLESPDVRERIRQDPKAFIASNKGGCVIDEIQYLPDLVSYIQVAVDNRKTNGEFIITGSAQFQLMEQVSQSLAGRTAIIRLLPLSMFEMSENTISLASINEKLFYGSYPRIFSNNLDPVEAYSFYIQTYLERDVRQIIKVQDLNLFERFLYLVAGRSAQILDYTSLSSEVGVDQSTIKRWISVLETSFIVSLLPPYFKNFNKRITKSPKIYMLDTGLLCRLLGIENPAQLDTHPLRGAIFETYVFSEIIKSIYNQVRVPKVFFFRDASSIKVDFLIEKDLALHAIEVKSGSTFSKEWCKNLIKFQKIASKESVISHLIYGGAEVFDVSNIKVAPLEKSEIIR